MSAQTIVSLEEYLGSAYEPDCDFVHGQIEERNVGELKHGMAQLKIGAYLLMHHGQAGAVVVTECRMRVRPSVVRIPDISLFLSQPQEQVPSTPPFLCVEILSPEDRMNRVMIRIQDYLEMGVAHVWIVDPETHQAYVATAANGLQEIKTGVLRTASPAIEVPLNQIF